MLILFSLDSNQKYLSNMYMHAYLYNLIIIQGIFHKIMKNAITNAYTSARAHASTHTSIFEEFKC